MANRTINSVFQLRGDTLANWKSKNPVLKDREVGIVVIPAGSESGLNEPAVLLKVGDGTTAFNSLGYVSAIAGDVKAWAKADTKPSYSASEISGLADFINSTITDTDTQYKIEQDESDGHILKFYSKAKDAENYTLVTTITTADTVYDDTELAGKVDDNADAIEALQTLVGETSVQAQIAAAITALNLANTYEAKGAAAEVLGSDEDDAGDATVYGANKAAAEAKSAADAAQGDVDDLAKLVGEIPNGDDEKPVAETVIAYVDKKANEAKTAATYDDTDVKKGIKDNADAIGVLNGDDTGKSARTIAAEEVAKVVDEAPEDLDTLKEIAAYIASDKTGAAEMNNAIAALQTKLTLGTDGDGKEYATVKAYVEAAIAALQIGDYAKAADLTALASRVEELEKAATNVAASETNGNIKVDGEEVEVYRLPDTVLDAGDTFTFDGGNA